MARTLLVLSSLLLAAPAHAALDPCATDLHPLARIAEARTYVYRSIRLPPPPVAVHQHTVISRGGAVVGQRVQEQLYPEGLVQQRVRAGFGAPVDFDALRATLISQRVGQQPSCFIANDLTLPSGVRVLGQVELTWYGRAGRTHSFTLVYGDPGTEGALPPCAAEALELEEAILTYADLAPANGKLCSSSRARGQ